MSVICAPAAQGVFGAKREREREKKKKERGGRAQEVHHIQPGIIPNNSEV